ncbi:MULTISPECIES: amino acid permease [Enterococcus]|uniref:Amino acid permease n=1 Tax=Enterococcus sulfureus ATCC 49903 TaxID=1140003 RepID=S0L313_9ENTE|nr:amino acid permease [Enterococcus sulfureus]EOT47740.1 amino acid permease [Enterococcus sulfureus ATCC 49903]EOT83839.1 amino acid permease [Enterococcus sulfureus ATCC 49903]
MEKEHLQRKLGARQIQMIALGGAIGVGLFMGSGATIAWTGPSVILAYLVAGMFLYLIMRALGEMLYIQPNSGSFAHFASNYLGKPYGYLTAWSNVFEYLIVGMSEIIAVGEYMKFWWPDLPAYIPGIIAIVTLGLANLISVKFFGELEFWFSFIKVFTIILMIIAGFGLIFFGFGNGGEAIGFSNLWSHGGFFTGGVKGFFFALSIVVSSYQGIELLGMTAGEAENPQSTITKAIKSTVGRILVFYVGAIFVIVTVYPWNELTTLGSPFVQIFSKIGITFAAGLINFVVLTAALSGCNSGIFSSSRMLYSMSLRGEMPKAFSKLTAHGVPLFPVVTMSVGILVGFVLNELLPLVLPNVSNLFIVVYSSSVLPGMIPWIVILLSQIKFREQHQDLMADHPFKMPFSPYSNYITLGFLMIVLIFMLINPETRISLLVGIIFLILVRMDYYRRFERR